jgi:hypothetical protein
MAVFPSSVPRADNACGLGEKGSLGPWRRRRRLIPRKGVSHSAQTAEGSPSFAREGPGVRVSSGRPSPFAPILIGFP